MFFLVSLSQSKWVAITHSCHFLHLISVLQNRTNRTKCIKYCGIATRNMECKILNLNPTPAFKIKKGDLQGDSRINSFVYCSENTNQMLMQMSLSSSQSAQLLSQPKIYHQVENMLTLFFQYSYLGNLRRITCIA